MTLIFYGCGKNSLAAIGAHWRQLAAVGVCSLAQHLDSMGLTFENYGSKGLQ